MSSYLNRTIGSVIGIGLIVGILAWGNASITVSHAFGALASTPVPVATPANGFTEVAKQVTPAVVNITTVMTEKISERSSVPDEFRDRQAVRPSWEGTSYSEGIPGAAWGPRIRGHHFSRRLYPHQQSRHCESARSDYHASG